MNHYFTIRKYAESTIEIEKSTFIGIVQPLCHENEVESLIHLVKNKYQNATHYVYAYTCGRNQLIQKFSDDGEPSGTGGMPILEIMKHKELEDIIIIVVRYFGGTKLGTGGLKRAYSRAAQEAIQLSGIKQHTLCRMINIRCPYTLWGKLQYELESKGILIEGIVYEEVVSIKAAIPLPKIDSFKEWINGITASQAFIEEISDVYREANID